MGAGISAGDAGAEVAGSIAAGAAAGVAADVADVSDVSAGGSASESMLANETKLIGRKFFFV